METKLIEEIYYDWVRDNPDSELRFYEFREICKLVEKHCVLQERGCTELVLKLKHPLEGEADGGGIVLPNGWQNGGTIVLRANSPRVVLWIEE